MVDVALVEVDFDDLTMNVQRRRALAIAKPISEGYWPCRSMINLTMRVRLLHANEEQAIIAIRILRIYEESFIDQGGVL